MTARETVCLVTSRVPWPAAAGAERRLQQHIFLLRQHYRVVVVTSANELGGDTPTDLNQLRDLVDELVVVPPSASFRARAGQALRLAPLQVTRATDRQLWMALRNAEVKHQSVCTYYSLVRTAPYLAGRRSPALLDYCDALSLQFARRAAVVPPAQRALFTLEARLLRRYEQLAGRQADATCVSAAPDRMHLAPLQPHVAGMAFDLEEPKLEAPTSGLLPTAPDALVITGDMSTSYSELSIVWFVQQVLPRVRLQRPGAELWVVGRAPTPGVLALASADASVHVTGSVPSVRAYLQRCAVAVAPLRYGTGVKTKILDAIAAGTPVVGTTVADDGMGAAAAGAMVVADEPDSMATAIVALLESPADREALAKRAEAFATSAYGAVAVSDALLGAVSDARRSHAVRTGM